MPVRSVPIQCRLRRRLNTPSLRVSIRVNLRAISVSIPSICGSIPVSIRVNMRAISVSIPSICVSIPVSI
jgi:hypothetical protein